MKSEIWIAYGSVAPSTINEEFTSGIDGYDVYIIVNEQKYRITNKELEQYKVETIK